MQKMGRDKAVKISENRPQFGGTFREKIKNFDHPAETDMVYWIGRKQKRILGGWFEQQNP